MELTKRDTKMIQGLSVLAMLCLHLFDRDYTGLFTPLVFVRGGAFELLFGADFRFLCDGVCVLQRICALDSVRTAKLHSSEIERIVRSFGELLDHSRGVLSCQ